MITVGLPNYASPIAWLAMESLSRQISPPKWELIVYEDSDKPLGEEFFESFDLPKCERVIYKYSKDRVSLSMKWIEMAKMSDSNSRGLVLQASDCYSGQRRLQNANLLLDRYNWIQTNQGYFYHIRLKKVLKFIQEGLTGLNMAIGMDELKQIKPSVKWSGVDYWLFTSIKDRRIGNESIYTDSVDTDGFSRISSRTVFYDYPTPPFHHTECSLEQLLPEDIVFRLLDIKHF